MSGLAASAALTSCPKQNSDKNLALRDLAKSKGLFYGAAVSSSALMQDQDLLDSVIRDCGIIIPEWEMKWKPTAPSENVTDFSRPDWLVDFADRNQMAIHAHTPVWHKSIPDWARTRISHTNFENTVGGYIRKFVSHFKGKTHSIGLVNEALNPTPTDNNIYRKSIFYENFGESFIQRSFDIANETDPDSRLYYSEFGVDYDDRISELRRNATLRMLEGLLNRGTPIHGIAIQGHLRLGRRYNPSIHRRFLRDLSDFNIDIIVSEFDINDRSLPSNTYVRDIAIERHAYEYLSTLFDEQKVKGLVTWGLSDKYSWLNNTAPYARDDGEETRGLPLSSSMERKPLWYAIAKAFDNAPSR